MFRHSTPHQCSLVHIYTCSCITLIHANLLSPSARGTRQHNQHMQTCVERHRARVLKRPQGKWALHYSDRHLLRSTRVLNNTEVKGHYCTICRHACFGVPRLISAAWYLISAAWYSDIYIYTRMSLLEFLQKHLTECSMESAQSAHLTECSLYIYI